MCYRFEWKSFVREDHIVRVGSASAYRDFKNCIFVSLHKLSSWPMFLTVQWKLKRFHYIFWNNFSFPLQLMPTSPSTVIFQGFYQFANQRSVCLVQKYSVRICQFNLSTTHWQSSIFSFLQLISPTFESFQQLPLFVLLRSCFNSA